MRMATVLHPRWNATYGNHMPPAENLTASDYVSVPALSLRGTWSVLELIPKPRVKQLAALTNLL